MEEKNKKDGNISRRDFVKTGLMSLGASAFALSGCGKQNETSDNSADSETPKQSDIYEFSCPLPFDFKKIDELAQYSSTLKKSKITTLFNNIPSPLMSKFDGFMQMNRGANNNIKTHKDFAKFVRHAYNNGFQFVYLLNSPKVFAEKDFLAFKSDFLYLLEFLKGIECNDIKVGNTQVCSLLDDHAPGEFRLHAATTFEYHNILQYNNFFENYHDFKSIEMAIDENQNFTLLKSMVKKYNDMKIELIVDDTTIKGSPARIASAGDATFRSYDFNKIEDKTGAMQFFLKSGVIFPWNLGYYSSIGINNFVFNPNKNFWLADYKDFTSVKTYLNCVENGIDKLYTNDLWKMFNIKNIGSKKAMLSDIVKSFPDMKYFMKNGQNCSSDCDINCFYCNECAKEAAKFII